MKYKNTFAEDWMQPLDKVERVWIRRPALIIITPFVIILGLLGGAITLTIDIYRDCW